MREKEGERLLVCVCGWRREIWVIKRPSGGSLSGVAEEGDVEGVEGCERHVRERRARIRKNSVIASERCSSLCLLPTYLRV